MGESRFLFRSDGHYAFPLRGRYTNWERLPRRTGGHSLGPLRQYFICLFPPMGGKLVRQSSEKVVVVDLRGF
jgi:hypothetical protein